MLNVALTVCTLLLLVNGLVIGLAEAHAAVDFEPSAPHLDDATGSSMRLASVVGNAVVSALEDSEQFGRKMVLDQIDVLQSLALEQGQLSHREEDLEAGVHAHPRDTVLAESSVPLEASTHQVQQLEQLAPLPLRMRRRRLQALLSFGAEAHHKEHELLQALVAEESQLELRAQSIEARHGRRDLRASMLAFPSLPSMASQDGGAIHDIDGFPMVEADAILKEQASIAALSSREEHLAERLDLLATRPQSHIAKFFFAFLGREPLESLPLHTGLNYLILFLLLTMFFPVPAVLKAGILAVILFIFAYFLLGRGFPAEVKSLMIIDWCLRILGCLYAFFVVCIVVQICRECFCPPPPPDEDGITAAGGDEAVERPLQDYTADRAGFTPAGSTSPPENDRDRVEENRRAAVEAILWRAQPIVLGALLIMLVLSITGLIVYIEGFFVWSKYREESCDQPLATWLLCTLVFQLISPCASLFLKQFCNDDDLAQLFTNVGFAVLIGIGFSFWDNCKVCHETNPYLYHYVQLYLIYNLLIWISTIMAGVGLVGLALWMQSMGLASGGQQPAPGLIDKMDTVGFQAGMQPEECSICCEKFAADGMVIARTPCGHVFHKDCLGEWLEKFGRTCPLCRKDLKKATETDIEAPMGKGGSKTQQTKSKEVGMRVHAPADNME